MISLEISGTVLGDQVVPPKLVRGLDWVENHWPHPKKGKGSLWPKVQLYCLMGVSGAWTVSLCVDLVSCLGNIASLGLARRLCRLFGLLPRPLGEKGEFLFRFGLSWPYTNTILDILFRPPHT